MNPTIPHIHRLQVRNYRCLEDIDISFSNLIALVGENGAGKSTILDALRFVRDVFVLGLDTALQNRHGLGTICRWSPRALSSECFINLHLRGGGWSGAYGFALASRPSGQPQVTWERFTNTITDEETGEKVQTVLETKEGKWVHIPESLQLKELHYGGEKWLSLSGQTLVFPALGLYLPATREVYTFLKTMGFYDLSPDVLREPQKPSTLTPLRERGENLGVVLRDLAENPNSEANTLIETALGQVVAGIHGYTVAQVGGYLITYLNHGTKNKDEEERRSHLELAYESNGTLRILGILTALFQEPPRSLLTIEEPEMVLHPKKIEVLVQVLKQASTRSQVLITTHHPDLIALLPADSHLIVKRENGWTTVFPARPPR